MLKNDGTASCRRSTFLPRATSGSPSSLICQSRDSSERQPGVTGGTADSLYLKGITWLIYGRWGQLLSGETSQAHEMGLLGPV
jgi:hypothetical protein